MNSQDHKTAELAEVKVPFLQPNLSEVEIGLAVDTLAQDPLQPGPLVTDLEASVAAQIGAVHCVGVSTCADALAFALEAIGVSEGEGVLVPTLTDRATIGALTKRGAIPIYVDCEPSTLNWDVHDLRSKLLSTRFKAVGMLPMHVGGRMADSLSLAGLASEFDLWVIENGAHAFGAAIRFSSEQPWRHCGNDTADMTCFALDPAKVLTSGEGGMIATASEVLATELRAIASRAVRARGNVARDVRETHAMTDLEASMLQTHVASAERARLRRQSIAQRYVERLESSSVLTLPGLDANRIATWQLFPVLFDLERLNVNHAKEIIAELKTLGIDTRTYWRPMHLDDQVSKRSNVTCTVAEKVVGQLVHLPIYDKLTDEQVELVIDSVLQVCEKQMQ